MGLWRVRAYRALKEDYLGAGELFGPKESDQGWPESDNYSWPKVGQGWPRIGQL
jgi:hypothetical protein